MGWDFQHSFEYKFVTSPPSILSYLIHSPQHPLESAARLLLYQGTRAPSVQPLAPRRNFFRETTEKISLTGPTRITYRNPVSSWWMLAAVCLQATRAQEIHPGPPCLFRKHSRCCTSCFVLGGLGGGGGERVLWSCGNKEKKKRLMQYCRRSAQLLLFLNRFLMGM